MKRFLTKSKNYTSTNKTKGDFGPLFYLSMGLPWTGVPQAGRKTGGNFTKGRLDQNAIMVHDGPHHHFA